MALSEGRRVLAEARLGLPEPVRSGDGRSEQDPAVWWRAMEELVPTLLRRLGGHRPRTLCIDGTSSTLLATDRAGDPLGPALMYDDRRGSGLLSRIGERIPDHSPVRSGSSSLLKAMWLQENRTLPARGWFLHQADWLLGRLAARPGVSDHNNALKLGYDPEARCWPDWLAATAIRRSWLPRVEPPGTPLGTIDGAVARSLGLPPDLQLVAGTTDSTAAFLAAGVTQPGEAVTSLGSTLVLKVLSTRPVWAPRYGVYSHRIGDLWLVGGASNSGGAVLQALFSPGQLAALTRQLDPGRPTGLDYYPLLRPGERFPVDDPALPPRLSPRVASDRVFFQGILEGIAEIERTGYARLQQLGAPRVTRVVTSGGGSANRPWMQIRARLLGIPVTAAVQQQAAYGTALLALDALTRPGGG